MSKFVTTNYTNRKEILKFPDHYVALPVLVDDTGIVANAEGKKIVVAGTIVGGTGGANSIVNNQATKATKHNTQGAATGAAGAGVDAEGVLMWDVDVTYGPASGAMIIHGFVDINKLPEAPSADAIAALKSRVTFLK
jgi:hypothetical protein